MVPTHLSYVFEVSRDINDKYMKTKVKWSMHDYKIRKVAEVRSSPGHSTHGTSIRTQWVNTLESGIDKKSLKIANITCKMCSNQSIKKLQTLPTTLTVRKACLGCNEIGSVVVVKQSLC